MARQYTMRIDADHPSRPGHFPANPIVPGVVLLDKVIECVAGLCATGEPVAGVKSAKFHSPLAFGADFQIEIAQKENSDNFNFRCTCGDTLIADGIVSTGVR